MFAALFFLAGTAHSASFPCKQAKSRIEKAICDDPKLSELDEHLGRYYSAARAALKPSDSCIVSDQRWWIRTVRDTCGDASCLQQAYLRRLAVLDPLQPGVTAIRNIELPSVNALVWIVPPALDQVAAPASKDLRPLITKGVILNEVTGGDGYVLRAGDGKRTLIVPLMFLEGPTTVTLESLAKVGGEYEVRGFAESGSDGIAHFAPSRCIFVYRISR